MNYTIEAEKLIIYLIVLGLKCWNSERSFMSLTVENEIYWVLVRPQNGFGPRMTIGKLVNKHTFRGGRYPH